MKNIGAIFFFLVISAFVSTLRAESSSFFAAQVGATSEPIENIRRAESQKTQFLVSEIKSLKARSCDDDESRRFKCVPNCSSRWNDIVAVVGTMLRVQALGQIFAASVPPVLLIA